MLRMPLKLKWGKKSGRYDLSQDVYVLTSTAKQCMEYLSQKVDLNQLDKPLRRQLERWACKPRQVQLAVLYHTPNAFTLTDQMARSYYFLLMKLDVVEGRLTDEDSSEVKVGYSQEGVVVRGPYGAPLKHKSSLSKVGLITSNGL
uniref:Uncharacterized protein n=1 Tax=Parascaris equorum TaxID=6256 RepID=A0A914RHA3_PAREQ